MREAKLNLCPCAPLVTGHRRSVNRIQASRSNPRARRHFFQAKASAEKITAKSKMGSAESSLSTSQGKLEGITTVSERSEGVDPILEKLKSLKIATPILTSLPPSESSLSDILVRKSTNSSSPGALNPKVLMELFSIYREWQEGKSKKISEKQEEIENMIEVADALAIKLLQRFNYSASAMKTAAYHLAEVHSLQVELGELKGRLTEVISNCDALCKRIAADGPGSLQSSVKPFAVAISNSKTSSSWSVLPRDTQSTSSTEI
ncbi:hypothetical protein RJ641_010661 [Dillenia turbinata]|uniref:BLOC-1-related complex subunit 5 n=1 Tax=Dillenia turbinata TaxID=194707 RepID=A0AAN8V6M8_9MAGN